MKKIRNKRTIVSKILLLFTAILAMWSCNERETPHQPRISLAGKVYGVCTAPDTAMGGQALSFISDLPTLLFTSDSSFIRIMPAAENGLRKNFTCTVYQAGSYQLDDRTLNLSFGTTRVTYYLESKIDSKGDTTIASAHAEPEACAPQLEKLIIHKIRSRLFFELCDVHNHLMAPKPETVAERVGYLKTEKIWDELMNKKK